ncbi:MAG: aldo/keto reductase [Actinomycetota bacterium]|nr:aldo/keto reductase [Actinomycetota bacterium]
MERRRLGRTGHESSVAILGGAAFAVTDEAGAADGFTLALDRGVNHLDIAPQYGAAERLVGPHLPAVRDRLFLACKTLRKHPDGVRAQLEHSLGLFGTDHVDLYQLHAVTTVEVLDERMGALAEIERARDEGLTRFVGITGHDMTAPATFREALRRHDFDTVMFPVYPRLWADADYRREAEALLETCAERDVGVMAIKAAAARPWAAKRDEGPDGDRWATSWYEPEADAEKVARGVRFALSTPGVHAFCTPGDLGVLPLALDAAERFTPADADVRAGMVAAQAGEDVIFPITV